MLKFEGFKVGQIIKAMDFKPSSDRPDQYCIGTIFDIVDHCGVRCYVIVSEEDTFEGRINETVFVPLEVDFLEHDNRVTLVN